MSMEFCVRRFTIEHMICKLEVGFKVPFDGHHNGILSTLFMPLFISMYEGTEGTIYRAFECLSMALTSN